MTDTQVSNAPTEFTWEFVIDRQTVEDYARSIGSTNPIFYDEAAAKAAGFPAIPAPPTFASVLYGMNALQGIAPAAVKDRFNTEIANPFGDDVDFSKGLHGGDAFEYARPIYVGDRLRIRLRPGVERYEKSGKAGTLVFHVLGMEIEDGQGNPVLTDRVTAIIRS